MILSLSAMVAVLSEFRVLAKTPIDFLTVKLR